MVEQQESLQAAKQRMEKASLRYKLYSAEIKKPIQQVQASLTQQSQVLLQLSAAQEQIKAQVESNEQLLGALQNVMTKQFQVTMQSIQKMQEQQTILSHAVQTIISAEARTTKVSHSSISPAAAAGPQVPDDPWRKQ